MSGTAPEIIQEVKEALFALRQEREEWLNDYDRRYMEIVERLTDAKKKSEEALA